MPSSTLVGRQFYFYELPKISTPNLNNDSRMNITDQPIFQVSILLRRKHEKTSNDATGEYLRSQSVEYLCGEDSSKTCLIPSEAVSSPETCTRYLFDVVSGMISNLEDDSLYNGIASGIGSVVSDHAQSPEGSLGFSVSAGVMVVEKFDEEVMDSLPEGEEYLEVTDEALLFDDDYYEVEEPMELTEEEEDLAMFDDDDFVRISRGVSESVLDKLKEERLCEDGGGGGCEIKCDTCVVCLEKFSSGVELIRLRCSHIFHEQCIFDWLEDSTSCPLCRSEVE